MKILNTSIAISATIVCIISIWILDKGFGVGDEAYFLQTLLHQPQGFSISASHMFFDGWFSNILQIRWYVFVSNILIAYIFSVSVFYFFQEKISNYKIHIIILAISIIALYISYMPIGDVISYNYLNRLVTLVAISSMLIALRNRENYWYLFIISGFFISLLLFIKFTNSVLILVLPIVMYLYCRIQNVKSFKILVLYCSGVLLGFLYYFVCIESITEYVENIRRVAEITVQEQSSTGHNLSMLIMWIFNAFKYSLLQIIPFVLLFVFYHFRIYTYVSHKIIQYAIHIILFLFLLFIVNFEIRANLTGIATYIPFLGLFISILLIDHKKYVSTELVISLFLLLIPMLLAFGSNVSFKHKMIEGFIFILPLLYIAFVRYSNRFYIIIFCILLGIYTLNFVSKLFVPNWSGIVPVKQTEYLPDYNIKQSIYVDSSLLKKIQEFNSLVPEGAYWTTNYYRIKGFGYVNNNIPIEFSYQPVDSIILLSIITFLEKTSNNLYIVEDNTNKFSNYFINKIQSNVACNIDTIKQNHFTVYICNRKNNEQ